MEKARTKTNDGAMDEPRHPTRTLAQMTITIPIHLIVNERCRTLPPPQKLRSLLSQRPSESSLCYRYFDTQ